MPTPLLFGIILATIYVLVLPTRHYLPRYKCADLSPYIVLGAFSLIFAVGNLQASDIRIGYLLLVVVTLGIGSRVIVHIPGCRGQISISDTFLLLSLILYDVEASVLLAGADALASSLRLNTKKLLIAFNASVFLCATLVTGMTLRMFFGSVAFKSPRLSLSSSSASARFSWRSCGLFSLISFWTRENDAKLCLGNRCQYFTSSQVPRPHLPIDCKFLLPCLLKNRITIHGPVTNCGMPRRWFVRQNSKFNCMDILRFNHSGSVQSCTRYVFSGYFPQFLKRFSSMAKDGSFTVPWIRYKGGRFYQYGIEVAA